MKTKEKMKKQPKDKEESETPCDLTPNSPAPLPSFNLHENDADVFRFQILFQIVDAFIGQWVYHVFLGRIERG